MSNKLQAKDLINLGLFTVLYFVIGCCVAIPVGFVPIFLPILGALWSLITGIPFMLSGEEFARTKFGSSDSYDSAKELNWLDWNRAWQKRDLIEYYAKLIALRKSDPQWFDGNRNIVDTEGDELVFRVGDYLMAANPGRHVGVIDVAVTGLEPIGGIRRYWCGLGSSVSPVEGNVSAGDGDYLIVPPHTFAIWRLQ